ncbi:MAG: DUF6159 family protein [Methanoregula sp.]
MTLARLGEIVHQWMGWCPNAPAMRTAATVLSTPPVTVNPLEPEGGAGGSERIGRGIQVATGSLKTLARNKQLLWFSLLTGLVMLFMIAAFFSLRVYGTYPYPAIAYPLWLALVFSIQAITVFCLYFLLAGMVLSVSAGSSGGMVSFRKGLSDARSHVRSIAGWSVGMALLGTALLAAIELRYADSLFIAISSIIGQFPFYFVLRPEVLGPGPIPTVVNPLSAATFTIAAMIINVVFFILTLFVVPVLVLENKRLPDAVAESFSLVKKVWGEIIASLLVFFLIVIVISLCSLIFRVAYGVVTFDDLFSSYQLFWYQGGWIASAALYILVWCTVTVICSTAVGVSLFGLYSYAKSGRMPGMFEGE